MVEKSAPLTLKKAAQQLGVHEQTLRSWERRGLLRMVRLPGSGYRRVPVEEVQRLAREMASPVGPPARSPDVHLVYPDTSPEAFAQAVQLAEQVKQYMEGVEADLAFTFDEWLVQRRGRMPKS
jgi:excisionase family DNA binding protein